MVNDIIKHKVINTGYLGLLPFFAGALGPWVFIEQESQFVEFFTIYSFIILSFMAGCAWAYGVFAGASHPQFAINLGLSIIGVALVASLTPTLASIGLLAFGFFLLWFGEKLWLAQDYPDWYQQLRHKLTWIVIACHMLTVWNIIHTPLTR